ncbi:hypothetical protein ACJ73_03314 [Blastomyces percursus]|uniref:Uncharacterized protein n=1 Tax=Blastomyces percursus TaxID=1658174 RepID=A0A1J9QA56_9EURO|nr:hypothetical protein ACJ73_03314 [Blastomyces percursus]
MDITTAPTSSLVINVVDKRLALHSNNPHASNGTIPLTESEERIFQDVKLQNLRVSAEPQAVMPAPQQQLQPQDIVVSTVSGY